MKQGEFVRRLWEGGLFERVLEEVERDYKGFEVRFYYKGELPKGWIPSVPPTGIVSEPVAESKIEDYEDPDLKLFYEVRITDDLKPGECKEIFAPLPEHVIKNRYPIYVKIDPLIKIIKTEFVPGPGGIVKVKKEEIIGNTIMEENENNNKFIREWPKKEDIEKEAENSLDRIKKRFGELHDIFRISGAREIARKVELAMEARTHKDPEKFIALNKELIEKGFRLVEELKPFVDESILKAYTESLESLKKTMEEDIPRMEPDKGALRLAAELNYLIDALAKVADAPPTVSDKENLIHNGDFSKGLEGWKWAHYGKRGKGEVEIIYDEEKASDVLYYKRTLSHNDGGAVWISQDLNIDVDKYSELVLEFDGKVIANTLKDSGWWSDIHGGIGEYPLQVVIKYEDAQGKIWEWNHGFLPNPDPWKRKNLTVVERNKWQHYASDNLVFMKTTKTGPHNAPIDSPPPKRIIGISIGGSGWDFEGMIDNVMLWGIPKD